MKKFWMVYRLGNQMPSKSHITEAEAETEARRLASKYPEEQFYVLETRSVVIGIVKLEFLSLI